MDYSFLSMFRYFIALSFIAVSIYFSSDYYINYEKNILGIAIHGKITEKEITKHNHGALYLHLDGADIIVVTREIFDLVEVGDSISKKQTDSCAVFFKNSLLSKSDTLYNYGFINRNLERIKCCCRRKEE